MIRPANVHELVREALDGARAARPDALVDVEHRGDGECEMDGPAFVEGVAALVRAALLTLAEGESLWMRSSGTDAARLAVDLRWRGSPPAEVALAAARRALAGAEVVAGGDAHERHVGVRLERWGWGAP